MTDYSKNKFELHGQDGCWDSWAGKEGTRFGETLQRMGQIHKGKDGYLVVIWWECTNDPDFYETNLGKKEQFEYYLADTFEDAKSMLKDLIEYEGDGDNEIDTSDLGW